MSEPSPETTGFEILYRHGACLAVFKPGGLLTQAPPGIDSLEARVKAWRRGEPGADAAPYLGLPHRLDRPAAGAMVLALDRPTARKLSRQFERREVEKTYWALVEGDVTPDRGMWTDFVAKLPDEARVQVVPPDAPDSRLAVLHYRVMARVSGGSCLEIRLETGRTHQVRVQAAARGHALWGDEMYGGQTPFGPPEEDSRARWIGLLARRLSLVDPQVRRRIDIVAPLRGPWAEWGELERHEAPPAG